jgi:hypothetical protein
MAAKIRVVMPDGEQVHVKFPVDAEAWSVRDGQAFVLGLVHKAFPHQPGPGRRLNVRMSVERGPGGVVVAVNVATTMQRMMRRFSKTNRTMRVGPFNPSVEGLDGVCSLATRLTVERKDDPFH